jgi:hypothetical protein
MTSKSNGYARALGASLRRDSTYAMRMVRAAMHELIKISGSSGQYLVNNSTFNAALTNSASAVGEYAVRLDVNHCQSNVATQDSCSVETIAPGDGGMLTVRDMVN